LALLNEVADKGLELGTDSGGIHNRLLYWCMVLAHLFKAIKFNVLTVVSISYYSRYVNMLY
jgi:hypothetical protein